ncbi:MAG: hypothetical protein AAGF57_21175 [Pseudomonadota bacterium]
MKLSGIRAQLNLNSLVILIAAALLILSYSFTEMAGGDLWWHLAAGRELLQTGSLWMVDDWSFTAHGKDWLNHEWLAGLLYYVWVSVFGLESLVYWKWLMLLATFGALLFALARTSRSPLAALISMVIALAAAAPFLDIRPHLYSLLGFTLLLVFALERRPWVPALALLFIAWVNLHGGVLFGLMALAILLFPWRERTTAAFRFAFGVFLICSVAAMLNPSGYKVFLYPLAYAFDSTSPFRTIGEWITPFEPGGIQSPLFFYLMWLPLLAPLYLLPAIKSRTGIPWEGIALTMLTLAMALTSRRFIPLFAISLAVFLAPLVALILRSLRVQKLSLGFGLLALFWGLYRLVPYPVQAGPAFHYLTAHYSFPVEMLNFVATNKINGKVYALWNWGGYIHWRTDGELKVFVDGRADTIYDDETYLQYVAVLSSQPDWIDRIENTEADYVLWSHSRGGGREKLRALLATGRWQPVYSDAVSWLLIRGDSAAEQAYLPSQPGPWRDLAMARNAQRAGDYEAATQYAREVRELMPWNRDGCSLLIWSYRAAGEKNKAEEVLRDCLQYFPTVFLR